MTEPGYVAPAAPGWWVRTNRVGTNKNGYNWAVTATGARASKGNASGTYEWAGSASGVRPADPIPSLDVVAGSWTTNVTSSPWTHVATAGVNYGIVFVENNYPTTITNIDWGGSVMTLLGVMSDNNAGGNLGLSAYGIVNPPTGSQTIHVDYSAFTQAVTYRSLSFFNVTSVGGIDTAFGPSAPSNAMSTSSYGQIIIHAFGGGGSGSSAFSAPAGGTTLALDNANAFAVLLVQQADASTTFTVTSAVASWGAVGVVLTR